MSIIGAAQRRIERLIHNIKVNRFAIGCKSVGNNLRISFPITTYGLENVTIGDNFKCGERLKLRTFNTWGGGGELNPEIVIGNNVNIETDCHISAINSVVIEDNVLMASFVYISDHSHGQTTLSDIEIPPIKRPLYSKGRIRICKNVWIGEKATILPNVTIGEGSVIGANAVVTRDIPSHCVAVGNPAKVIRHL